MHYNIIFVSVFHIACILRADVLKLRIHSRISSMIRDSIVVSIPACHAGDPGSIPGGRDFGTRPRNRGLTVRILALQASGPGSTPGGCTFARLAWLSGLVA